MALKPIVLVEPTTLGEVATHQLVGADIPATLMADNLDGSETIEIFRVTDGDPQGGGDNVFQDGTQVELSVTNNTITVNSPMTIGVTKGVTVNAVGIFIATQGLA